jgi:hypothetical protein
MDKTKDNNEGYGGKKRTKIQRKRRLLLDVSGLRGLI